MRPKQCRRCRQEVPSQLATRIRTSTGSTGGLVYLCPACYAQWWADEQEAAQRERGLARRAGTAGSVLVMWARSEAPQAGRTHVWHRVTVVAWNPDVLQTACDFGGVLRKCRSTVQVEPPTGRACTRCLGTVSRRERGA